MFMFLYTRGCVNYLRLKANKLWFTQSIMSVATRFGAGTCKVIIKLKIEISPKSDGYCWILKTRRLGMDELFFVLFFFVEGKLLPFRILLWFKLVWSNMPLRTIITLIFIIQYYILLVIASVQSTYIIINFECKTRNKMAIRTTN